MYACTQATYNELVNSVLRVAHLHLYRDLIRLYAVYNEAMINLIGRYFTMSKRDCRTSLVTYKSFLKRMESMNAFVKIAEATDNTGLAHPTDTDSITFQPSLPVGNMTVVRAAKLSKFCLMHSIHLRNG
ncbi:unnamed protein product [Echinostoma caproni]|uniref:ANTH domain-containing protein n=1 Tax=Echinostoma caproni TaxID=27848 RepID=A0A183APL6_9TREM|nr:unnamed protein product [Echinostoma caproni]